jgi:acyl carrier protein
MDHVDELTPELLRELVQEHCDFDPGPLEERSSLAGAGITGIHRLWVLAALEDRYRIEFPADLLSAIESVDDLTYYTRIKVEQREEDRPREGGRR